MEQDLFIYGRAVNDGMPSALASFIAAQARHETGNYKHRFFTVGNNAFGYMYVKGAKWQLPTPGDKADNNAAIAQYASVDNSVHELTDWIKRRQNEGKFPADLFTIATPHHYARLLKDCGYYGATYKSYSEALYKHWQALPADLKKAAGCWCR